MFENTGFGLVNSLLFNGVVTGIGGESHPIGTRQLIGETRDMLTYASLLIGGAEVVGIDFMLKLVREYRRQLRAFRDPSSYVSYAVVILASHSTQ